MECKWWNLLKINLQKLETCCREKINRSTFSSESVCLFPVLQDLTKGVLEISTFFGFKLTEAQVQQISESSTFSAMKKSSAGNHTIGNIIFRKGAPQTLDHLVVILLLLKLLTVPFKLVKNTCVYKLYCTLHILDLLFSLMFLLILTGTLKPKLS